jgi:hypothetical protein
MKPTIFLALIALVGFGVSHVGADSVIPASQNLALTNAQDVGVALKTYADEHGGKLPQTLAALSPDYLADPKRAEHMFLTTPGAILADLSPDSVIAIRSVPDDGRYVVVVYSTIATKRIKP